MVYLLDFLQGFAVGFVGGAVLFVLGGIAFVVMPFIFNNLGNPVARGLGRVVRLVYRPQRFDSPETPETPDTK